MKVRLIKYILGISAITFVMTGCSKNEDELASVVSNKQDILTFKTAEEFNTTIQKVNSMKLDERVAWEKSQGFKSFGTICDEFYKTIEPQNFKNIQEINDFIAKNNDKVQIYSNEAGDKYCEVQEFDNSARYLMNKDRMYIIGSKAIKKFNECSVSTDIVNIEALKKAKNYSDFKSNSSESTVKYNSQKISSGDYGQYQENYHEAVVERKGLFGIKYYTTYRLVVRLRAENIFDGYNTFNHYGINVANYYWSGVLWLLPVDTKYNVIMSSADLDPSHNFTHVKYVTNYTSIQEVNPLDDMLYIFGGYVNTQVHITSYNIDASNTYGCTIKVNQY
jgi:hypothetical protein